MKFVVRNITTDECNYESGCAMCEHVILVTVRRYALHGLSYRNSVRPSVCPSVCHTRALCPHGSTYDQDFFTIW